MNEVIDWTRIDGELLEIKYQNKVWALKGSRIKKDTEIKVNSIPDLMTEKKRGQKTKLQKWLMESKKPGDKFTLDEFYKEYPEQRQYNARMQNKYLPEMCSNNEVTQYKGKEMIYNGCK